MLEPIGGAIHCVQKMKFPAITTMAKMNNEQQDNQTDIRTVNFKSTISNKKTLQIVSMRVFMVLKRMQEKKTIEKHTHTHEWSVNRE